MAIDRIVVFRDGSPVTISPEQAEEILQSYVRDSQPLQRRIDWTWTLSLLCMLSITLNIALASWIVVDAYLVRIGG